MKHTIILLALLAVGCKQVPIPAEIERRKTIGSNIYTYTIDSCEYIGRLNNGNADVLTHSGTCPNPIHYSDTCKHK